jgi:putative oxidoreductase
MPQWIETTVRYYARFARLLTYPQDGFLLLVRLYWGWQLIGAGWGKLMNVAATAQFFEGLGIPLPTFNAILSGCGELGGGILLIGGLASRPAAMVVVVNMLVALLTAHTGDVRTVLSEPSRFLGSPPFTFLMAGVIVLLFGPGAVSLDTLVRRYMPRLGLAANPADPSGGIGSDTTRPDGDGVTRRDVARLTAAAVGGLVAGLGLRGLMRPEQTAPPAGSGTSLVGPEGGPTPTAEVKAIQAIDAAAPPEIKPSLLLEEPHTCCGLNTCKGRARDGKNACLGQGTCATAKGHVCQAQNDCKGQGGCGEYPGQNACDGKGACAVPLKRDTWPKARKRFEELAKLAGKVVGGPPPNCPKS